MAGIDLLPSLEPAVAICTVKQLKQQPNLDQVWSILPALFLLPLVCWRQRREQSRGSNSNAGKMDQTWSKPNQTASDPRQISTLINYVVIFRKMNFWNFVKFDKLSNVLDKEIGLDDSLLWNKQSMED